MPDEFAPRRSLFALWKWPWWARVVIVPAVFGLYALSASLAFFFAMRYKSPWAFRICEYVYWPVDRMYRHWAWVRAIGDWLNAIWVPIFG